MKTHECAHADRVSNTRRRSRAGTICLRTPLIRPSDAYFDDVAPPRTHDYAELCRALATPLVALRELDAQPVPRREVDIEVGAFPSHANFPRHGDYADDKLRHIVIA